MSGTELAETEALDLYVYKFNLFCQNNSVAQMTELSLLKTILPSTIRGNAISTHPSIPNAGWHFSWLDNTGGDKGQLDGKTYAPSYFGDPGSGNGGKGYGLNGRGSATYNKVIPDCQEEGRVVVEIHVDRSGKVIKAIPGKRGTTGDACLYQAAKETALSHRWKADSKAPATQIGWVKIDFSLGQ